MRKGKVWGTTETLVKNAFVQLHRIEVRSGGYCSTHEHRSRWNAFLVLEGSLRLITTNTAGEEHLDMSPGDFCAIPPGEVHSFVNIGAFRATALELYYPEGMDGEDIIRHSEGGAS